MRKYPFNGSWSVRLRGNFVFFYFMWPLIQGMHLCCLIVNSNSNAKGDSSFTVLPLFILMDIMWPIDKRRLRSRQFHTVSCQNKVQTYQFGEINSN